MGGGRGEPPSICPQQEITGGSQSTPHSVHVSFAHSGRVAQSLYAHGIHDEWVYLGRRPTRRGMPKPIKISKPIADIFPSEFRHLYRSPFYKSANILVSHPWPLMLGYVCGISSQSSMTSLSFSKISPHSRHSQAHWMSHGSTWSLLRSKREAHP